jgi:hypothetical protein
MLVQSRPETAPHTATIEIDARVVMSLRREAAKRLTTVPALIRHVAGEPSLVRAILDDD